MLNCVSIILIVLSVLPMNIYCNPTSPKRYDNYKVFRIVPTIQEQVESLLQFEKRKDNSFWIEPNGISMPVDLLVAPIHLNDFNTLMTEASITPQILIQNVQPLIDMQTTTTESRAGGSVFSFETYNSLEEIYAWMEMMKMMHDQTVQTINGGETYEKRTIKGLRLRFGMEKPGIFIEGGMHGREWISPATVVYLINTLLNSRDPAVREMAESFDWYIFPVCNPDGYVYSQQSNRLWQKTLSYVGWDDTDCKGVDLNRNYGYKWQGLKPPDDDVCQERFPGHSAFSESESRGLAYYMHGIQGKLFAYISIHSYSQFLLLPYDHTKAHLENYNSAHKIGLSAIAALSNKFGTQYKLGTRAKLTDSIATGTAMDWAKGFLQLDLAFTYKLRDTGGYGFLLPPEYIVPNSEEFVDSLVAMFQKARSLGYPKNKRRDISSGEGSSSGSGGRSGKGIFKIPMCFSGG